MFVCKGEKAGGDNEKSVRERKYVCVSEWVRELKSLALFTLFISGL